VLDCEACAGCGASPFTLKWERMCLACSYDIQIMDEDGNLIVEWVDKTITGDPPKLYVDSGETAMVETEVT
jgi:Fe-S cluster biogenesis protein NfuA